MSVTGKMPVLPRNTWKPIDRHGGRSLPAHGRTQRPCRAETILQIHWRIRMSMLLKRFISARMLLTLAMAISLMSSHRNHKCTIACLITEMHAGAEKAYRDCCPRPQWRHLKVVPGR